MLSEYNNWVIKNIIYENKWVEKQFVEIFNIFRRELFTSYVSYDNIWIYRTKNEQRTWVSGEFMKWGVIKNELL